MGRNVLVSIFSTHDGGGKNWVGGREAGRYSQAREEVESWNERINETCRNEPALYGDQFEFFFSCWRNNAPMT
jgi:hypothetical protein